MSQPSGNTGSQHDTPDCHFTMQTGEKMQIIKLVARMPCPHTMF